MSLRHRKAPFLLLFLTLLTLGACHSTTRTVHRGTYYWKTQYTIDSPTQSVLEQLACNKQYIRFFDVDLDSGSGKIVPLAPVSFYTAPPRQEIIPVVFITPAALYALDRFSIPELAQHICALLEQKCAQAGIQPQEIQIDCDWTTRNKSVYFNLLNHIRTQAFCTNKRLSVTIRLHQVKYIAKSGIPPADRGLLMCYNMGRLKDIKEQNSILNVATAASYLDNLKHYPLPLDIALPIFHWVVLFEREQYKGILRDIDQDQLLAAPELFHPEGTHTFSVRKDSLWQGFDLKRGQWLRYENSDIQDVQKLATFVAGRLHTDTTTILLYHCDLRNFKKYTSDELEKIFTRF